MRKLVENWNEYVSYGILRELDDFCIMGFHNRINSGITHSFDGIPMIICWIVILEKDDYR